MKPLLIALGFLAWVCSPGVASAQELPPGHPPLDSLAETKAPPEPQLSEQDLLKKLDEAKGLKEQAKPFEIAAALGKLYYGRGRFGDAAEYLEQAAKMAEPTRAFYLEQRRKARAAKKALPGAEVAGCARGKDGTLAELAAKSRQVAKTDAPASAACALSALEPLREVFHLLANARFILGDARAAIAAREMQLEVFEADPEGLFARGAMVLDTSGDDLKALGRAREDFARLLKENPASPKLSTAKKLAQRVDEAIAAGGITRLAQKNALARKAGASAAPLAPGELVITPQMLEAVQNTERTPELAAGFQKLIEDAEEHLARGRYQEALASCSRVVPFEPENARARSSMAWALVQLDRQPMAERVWTVAVSADPSALDKLGELLKSKGDQAGAKALWTRLARSAPEYAKGAKLAEKLE